MQFLLSFLIVICAGVFIFAGYKLFTELKEYKDGEQAYEKISDSYAATSDDVEKLIASGELNAFMNPSYTPRGEQNNQTDQNSNPAPNTSQEGNQGIDIVVEGEAAPGIDMIKREEEERVFTQQGVPYTNPFNVTGLKEQWPNVVGWVYIPKTVVSYPIVQGDDNTKYLRTTVDEQYNKAGAIFMDYESEKDFTGEHTVIYGHNLKNGKMFADLIKYKEKDFFEQNPYVYLFLEDRVLELRIVSAYPAKAHSSQRQMLFGDRAEFESYVQNVLDQCDYSLPIEVDKVSQLFTLATCSYEWNDTRTYVHAVLSNEIPLEQTALKTR